MAYTDNNLQTNHPAGIDGIRKMNWIGPFVLAIDRFPAGAVRIGEALICNGSPKSSYYTRCEGHQLFPGGLRARAKTLEKPRFGG